MSVFAAVASFRGDTTISLPTSCVAALRLPGASSAVSERASGYACAGASTGWRAPAIHVLGEVIVTGDVRLDARADLRRAIRETPGALLAKRAAPGESGDLALVHAAYAAWGVAAVERLRGDFSFALWDGATGTFVAARDGLGVRPLYYASIPGGICVSNTLDAVRAHPAVTGGLNVGAVVSFLEITWNRDLATTTFSAIARLPPGTMLRRLPGQHAASVDVHWTMPDPSPLEYRREADYVEHYRALLDEAVRDRMTGPTAILLSGGLDSPSMAATARRVAPEHLVYAQTTRMPEVESPEEARLATAVAQRLGIAHEVREFDVVPLPGEGGRTPEPCFDFEDAANSEFVSLLGKRAPVVLVGEDGDALFSPPGMATMLRRYPPVTVLWWMITDTIRRGHHPYLGFWLARRLRFWRPRRAPRPTWMRHPGCQIGEPPVTHRARPEAYQRLTSSLWQMMHQGWDRAFTGAPVEIRWPFLDSRLLEFVFAIPPVPWCQRKHLMRRAFASELPADVIRRPKTTVPGYFELATSKWRRRTAGAVPPLSEHTKEFVDSARLIETLATGDSEAVLAGWRALTLDRWLRDLEAA
ncbi:MAG: asparagine synthase-related protein [Gemmatimonadetes bacterium]|nr:asparagine synthase-related protein [Gemmatimonadota bacterium]